MIASRLSLCGALVLLVVVFSSGCGEQGPIELSYQKPAQYQIPAKIKRIGIAEFGGQTSLDKKWGDIASDRLAAALDELNRRFHRYQLVDRQRIQAILDEQDLQTAVCDTASAGQVGKLADVQAMIYGSVKVTVEEQNTTRTTFDPIHQTMRTVPYTRRFCLAAVNFTMDDLVTGKTLAAVSVTRQYDSDKDKSAGGKLGRVIGFAPDKTSPVDQIISGLIDQCVQEFVNKISPHEIVVTEKLQRCKVKAGATANKLAKAGEYEEALEIYLQIIKARPDDHGAAFNAGLMYEALGQLDKAEQFYDKAFRINPKERYVLARKRVRDAARQGQAD